MKYFPSVEGWISCHRWHRQYEQTDSYARIADIHRLNTGLFRRCIVLLKAGCDNHIKDRNHCHGKDGDSVRQFRNIDSEDARLDKHVHHKDGKDQDLDDDNKNHAHRIFGRPKSAIFGENYAGHGVLGKSNGSFVEKICQAEKHRHVIKDSGYID